MSGAGRRQKGHRSLLRVLQRKLWRTFLFTTLGLLAAWIVVTRTAVTRGLTLPALSRALGVEVEASSVVVSPDLRLVLRGVVVRVPGVMGPAGELIRVGRMDVEPDWRALRRGEAGASRIEMIDPTVRISRDARDGRLNFELIELPAGRGGELPPLPTLLIRRALVEVGEHDAGGYTVISRLRGSGSAAPSGSGEPGRSLWVFDGSLEQGPASVPFQITGRTDAGGAAMAFSGLAIDGLDLRLLPPEVRPAIERLGLEGRVRPVSFEASAGGDVALTLALERVGIDVPASESSSAGAEVRLRLEDVAGELSVGGFGIRANLRGRADTITYDVAVDRWGLGADSPFLSRFRADPFRLERDLRLLRFAPSVVIERLEMFGNPTAEVDAEVWLASGVPPPGAARVATANDAAPQRVIDAAARSTRVELLGALRVRDGVAAYRGFPYEFRGMHGAFVFDRESLEIVDLEGVAPSGARLLARGRIAPLGDDAEVNINVDVTEMPVDDSLRAVLGPGYLRALEVLFSQRRYRELVEEGLVRTPEEAAPMQARAALIEAELGAWLARGFAGVDAETAALEAELAALRADLAARPVFGLGGTASARIDVHRELGTVSVWTKNIRVKLPVAGVVPEHFPAPLVGRDIELVLDDEVMRLSSGACRTLSGGEIRVTAEAPLAGEGGGALATPTVKVSGSGIPIDDLLLRAVPGPEAGEDGQPDAVTRILKRINLAGTLGCDVRVGPGPDGRVDFRVDVRVESATAAVPAVGGEGDPLAVDGVRGIIVVDPEEVVIALDATLRDGAVASDGVLFIALGLTELFKRADGEGDGAGGAGEFPIFVEGTVPRLDLRLPVEAIAGLFVDDAASRLADLRRQYRPEGTAALTAIAQARLGRVDAAPDLFIALRHAERISVATDRGEIVMEGGTGAAMFTTRDLPTLQFDRFEGALSVGGEPAGRLSLNGWLQIGPPRAWPLLGSMAPPTLEAQLLGARFESPLVGEVMSGRFAEGAASLYNTLRPEGLFDLRLWLTRGGTSTGDAGSEPLVADGGALANLRARGVIRPRSLSFDVPRGRVHMPGLDGELRFTERGGSFAALRGWGEAWSFLLDGEWSIPAPGALRASVRGGVEGRGLPEDLVPLLPGGVMGLLENLRVDLGERFVVSDALLTVDQREKGIDPAFRLTGRLDVEGGGLVVGVPIEDLYGGMTLNAWQAQAGEGTQDQTASGFELVVAADRLRAAGLDLRDVRGEVLSGLVPGEVLVPSMEGRLHHGRVAGSVRVGPGVGDASSGDASELVYSLRLSAADVRFAELLADRGVAVPASQTAAAAPGAGDDRTRGLLDAELTLSGVVGAESGARGRGTLRIAGGSVVELPLLAPLLEFSSLQVPVGSRLDLAEAAFYVQDDRLSFESIGVQSGSVELIGYGDMGWPGGELDLRFRTIGSSRIPVVSDVIEQLRDEVVTTKVSGTIQEPRVSTEPFSGTRRLLGAVLGRPADPRAETLQRLDREAAAARQRRGLRAGSGGGPVFDPGPVESPGEGE